MPRFLLWTGRYEMNYMLITDINDDETLVNLDQAFTIRVQGSHLVMGDKISSKYFELGEEKAVAAFRRLAHELTYDYEHQQFIKTKSVIGAIS